MYSLNIVLGIFPMNLENLQSFHVSNYPIYNFLNYQISLNKQLWKKQLVSLTISIHDVPWNWFVCVLWLVFAFYFGPKQVFCFKLCFGWVKVCCIANRLHILHFQKQNTLMLKIYKLSTEIISLYNSLLNFIMYL